MPDLLLLDDFGLRKLTAQQSSDSYSDCYDVLVERHRRAATIITSDRAVDEWVALFDDPIRPSRSRLPAPERTCSDHADAVNTENAECLEMNIACQESDAWSLVRRRKRALFPWV